MNPRQKFNLSFFIVIVLSYVMCIDIASQDKVINQKLLTAISDADAKTVSALLSSSADVETKDEDGLTALMYAAIYADTECVELLLLKGADPNARSQSGITPLMMAINNAAKVKLLISKGAEINAKSKQGHTALTIAAARTGTAETIKLLLDSGADLSVGNPLAAAVRSEDIKVIKLLLERGSDPHNTNNVGGERAMSDKRKIETNTRKLDGIPLISPILGLNFGNVGGTPLIYSALAGNTEIIKLLLAKGANINALHQHNVTALMIVAQVGNPNAVHLMLSNGSEVNIIDGFGYSALMYAVASESNDSNMIIALLNKGAKVDVKAGDGQTALKLAGRKGKSEIVRLLQKAGAKE